MNSGPHFPPVYRKSCYAAFALRCICRLGLLHELGEARRVLHGNVGQNLAVELDAGLLQSADELRIAGPVQLACGGDTHDPQRAELALLQSPAACRRTSGRARRPPELPGTASIWSGNNRWRDSESSCGGHSAWCHVLRGAWWFSFLRFCYAAGGRRPSSMAVNLFTRFRQA